MDSARMVIVGFCQPAAGEAGSVDDEEIFIVVALAPFVEHAALRVVAHAAGADLVDAVAGRVGNCVFGKDLKASCFSYSGANIDGVLCHVEFVVSVLCLHVEDGDTPSVNFLLVDADVIFVTAEDLAHDGHVKGAPTVFVQLLLQLHAVGGKVTRERAPVLLLVTLKA